jgi:hypothetical protein
VHILLYYLAYKYIPWHPDRIADEKQKLWKEHKKQQKHQKKLHSSSSSTHAPHAHHHQPTDTDSLLYATDSSDKVD